MFTADDDEACVLSTWVHCKVSTSDLERGVSPLTDAAIRKVGLKDKTRSRVAGRGRTLGSLFYYVN